MQLILNPLIINILFCSILILLFHSNIKLLGSLIYRSSNVFQYKIYKIPLSIIFISCYIGIIVILLYIMRLYYLPRNFDLKLLPTIFVSVKNAWTFMFEEYSAIIKIYIFIIIILILMFVSFLLIKGHKLAYKEMHKLFLWSIAQNYFDKDKNIYLHNIKHKLFWISLRVDILYYYLNKILYYLAKDSYKTGATFKNWPQYHPYRLLQFKKVEQYYSFLILISPILVILYDCIFNDFIITHVFYYLLFYIPLRLFKRLTDCVSTNASYITKWLFELYYKDEDCLYAASPTLKAILDNFILSGIIQNYTLGVQCEAELIVCALTRFELADKHGPLDETYVNEDSQYLHTFDRIHYYHAVADENGNPTHGTEWVVIFDKTKHIKGTS